MVRYGHVIDVLAVGSFDALAPPVAAPGAAAVGVGSGSNSGPDGVATRLGAASGEGTAICPPPLAPPPPPKAAAGASGAAGGQLSSVATSLRAKFEAMLGSTDEAGTLGKPTHGRDKGNDKSGTDGGVTASPQTAGQAALAEVALTALRPRSMAFMDGVRSGCGNRDLGSSSVAEAERQCASLLGLERWLSRPSGTVKVLLYAGAITDGGDWLLGGGRAPLQLHGLLELWVRARKHSQRLVVVSDGTGSGSWVCQLRTLPREKQVALGVCVQASDTMGVPSSRLPQGLFTLQMLACGSAAGHEAALERGLSQPSFYCTQMSRGLQEAGSPVKFLEDTHGGAAVGAGTLCGPLDTGSATRLLHASVMKWLSSADQVECLGSAAGHAGSGDEDQVASDGGFGREPAQAASFDARHLSQILMSGVAELAQVMLLRTRSMQGPRSGSLCVEDSAAAPAVRGPGGSDMVQGTVSQEQDVLPRFHSELQQRPSKPSAPCRQRPAAHGLSQLLSASLAKIMSISFAASPRSHDHGGGASRAQSPGCSGGTSRAQSPRRGRIRREDSGRLLKHCLSQAHLAADTGIASALHQRRFAVNADDTSSIWNKSDDGSDEHQTSCASIMSTTDFLIQAREAVPQGSAA